MFVPLVIMVLASILFSLWLLSLYLKNASIIDIFWGPGFAIVAWICIWQHNGKLSWGHWLLAWMVSVWALRLGIYLAWRNVGKGEDYRYRAMRKRIGPRFWWVSLGSVFALQGALMWLISQPIQVFILTDSKQHLSLFSWITMGIWLAGLYFETMGDISLARFKANPNNAGKVMDQGLWRYTRHPNYFGDFLAWWGLTGFTLSLGAPWWLVVSPLLMTLLLMRVSGVPLLEKALKSRRPGYADYIRKTSSFFPRPPKP
jgi:steroid 5-alpha reductase family enzyme